MCKLVSCNQRAKVSVVAEENSNQPNTANNSIRRYSQNPRRFLRKLIWFLLIPTIIYVIWVIIIPVNLYNFRTWEAISPYYLELDMPFYLNQYIVMVEVGELGAHTEYAISKQVTFITDNYGYRFDAQQYPSETYSMVIVGDSMTAGSSLTQDDTLSSVLSERLNQIVYPFAPATIDTLLRDERFGSNLPQTVILQTVERGINADICPQTLGRNPQPRYFMEANPFLAQIMILADQTLRHYVYLRNYLNARVSGKSIIVSDDDMVFFDVSIESPSIETIQDVVTSLQRCQVWFEEQDIKFIFLPIPDRENIYFDEIPHSHRPSDLSPEERSLFLRQLILELQRNDVTVIDTLSAYELAKDTGIHPYHLDDTHWNATGVQIVADLIIETLQPR